MHSCLRICNVIELLETYHGASAARASSAPTGYDYHIRSGGWWHTARDIAAIDAGYDLTDAAIAVIDRSIAGAERSAVIHAVQILSARAGIEVDTFTDGAAIAIIPDLDLTAGAGGVEVRDAYRCMV